MKTFYMHFSWFWKEYFGCHFYNVYILALSDQRKGSSMATWIISHHPDSTYYDNILTARGNDTVLYLYRYDFKVAAAQHHSYYQDIPFWEVVCLHCLGHYSSMPGNLQPYYTLLLFYFNVNLIVLVAHEFQPSYVLVSIDTERLRKRLQLRQV